MNYTEFQQIKSLIEEREQLKQGMTLIREMAVKTTSLPNHEVRLVFTEKVVNHYAAMDNSPESWSQWIIGHGLRLPQAPVKEENKGMVVLEDIILLKVAWVMADYWEERMKKINSQIKALGMEP